MSLTFNPSEPLGALTQRATGDVAAWLEHYSKYGYSQDRILDEIGGDVVGQMKLDQRETIERLRSNERSLRISALLLIHQYWISDPSFAPHCLSAAFADSDEVVRGLAIFCTSRLRTYIDDPSGNLKVILSRVIPARDQGTQAVIAQATERCKSLFAEVDRKMRENWQTEAEEHLSAMLQSPGEAEAFIWCADRKLRRVALSVLAYHWKDRDFALAASERIVADKTAPGDLRAEAVAVMAWFYRSTNDARVGAYFAGIVSDADEEFEVRRFAYLALFLLRGVPAAASPISATQFPNDVNWELFRAFRLRDNWREECAIKSMIPGDISDFQCRSMKGDISDFP